MEKSSVYTRGITCIYFSPTGSTKNIVQQVAKGTRLDILRSIDCTKRATRNRLFVQDELEIIGSPVYYGRLPEEILPYFASLNGRKCPAVIVVVYGNRDYGDALRELYDIVASTGFVPIAGAAFIAEHSYSSVSHPIADGRPDSADLLKAREFGAKVKRKLTQDELLDPVKPSKIPGHSPYIEHRSSLLVKRLRKSVSMTPETDPDICIRCNRCVESCPTGAISLNVTHITNKSKCLICFACIRNCPSGARQMKDAYLTRRIQELFETCRERNEPEIFL